MCLTCCSNRSQSPPCHLRKKGWPVAESQGIACMQSQGVVEKGPDHVCSDLGCHAGADRAGYQWPSRLRISATREHESETLRHGLRSALPQTLWFVAVKGCRAWGEVHLSPGALQDRALASLALIVWVCHWQPRREVKRFSQAMSFAVLTTPLRPCSMRSSWSTGEADQRGFTL